MKVFKTFSNPPRDFVPSREDMGCEVDTTHFPYVVVRLQKYYTKSFQVRGFLTALGDVYKRSAREQKRFVIVMDITNLSFTKPGFVFDMAKWFLAMRQNTANYMLCSMIVIESEVLKNFIDNWLFRFVKRTRPNYMAKDIEECWIWLMYFLWSQSQGGME